jgi:hypothetical protein
MSIIDPLKWEAVRQGTAERAEEATKVMGETVAVSDYCQHLAWECPDCERVLEGRPEGWYCLHCHALKVPARTRCRRHDREPKGCSLFPRTLGDLAKVPRCSYTFEEVVPRWQLRKK